jgi:hypothetical protein
MSVLAALIEKEPVSLVMDAVVVPLTVTVTPGNGLLFSSKTLPVMVLFWALLKNVQHANRNDNNVTRCVNFLIFSLCFD